MFQENRNHAFNLSFSCNFLIITSQAVCSTLQSQLSLEATNFLCHGRLGHSFIHSFFHSFIHSFIHLFIHSISLPFYIFIYTFLVFVPCPGRRANTFVYKPSLDSLCRQEIHSFHLSISSYSPSMSYSLSFCFLSHVEGPTYHSAGFCHSFQTLLHNAHAASRPFMMVNKVCPFSIL